jgi:hypothetical protein
MMRRRLIAYLGSAVLATALVLSGSPPASAGDELPSRALLRDGPGDVRQWVAEEQTYVAADQPEADVLRAQVRHRRGEVKIRILFADLRRVSEEQTFRAVTETPRGWYGSTLTVSPGAWGGRVSLVDFTEEAVWRCPGHSHFVDYGNNAVIIRVPRNCLQKPTWVKGNLTVRSGFTKRLYRSCPRS